MNTAFPFRRHHPNTFRWTDTDGFPGELQVEVLDAAYTVIHTAAVTVGPSPDHPAPAETAVAYLPEALSETLWADARYICLSRADTRERVDLAPLARQPH